MAETTIAIIDYDAGNIKSVEKALQYLGVNALLTRDRDEILNADKVILLCIINRIFCLLCSIINGTLNTVKSYLNPVKQFLQPFLKLVLAI